MRARYAGTIGLLIALAIPAAAQQPPIRRVPAPRQAAPVRPEAPPANAARQRLQGRMAQGASPEALLRVREQLGLTEAQVSRLEALRQEGVTAQRNRMTDMLETRSLLRAGRITREQLEERARARAAQPTPAGQQALGERARGVLTDQQRITLAERQVAQLRQQVQGRQMQRSRAGRGAQPGSRGRVDAARPGMPRGVRPAAPQARERLEAMRERMRARPVPPPIGAGAARVPDPR